MRYLILLLTLIGCNSSPAPQGKSTIRGKASSDTVKLSLVKEIILDEGTDKSWPVDITDFQYVDGRLYLLDTFKSQQAYVYDDNGKLITLIGGPGQGPGEYRYPGGLCLSGDQVHVIAANRQYFLYTKYGAYIKSNMNINPGGMSNRIFMGPVDGTALFVMYSRELPTASLYEVDRDANLIRKFSPPDEEFNLLWDMINPQGTVVVLEDQILQVFSHRYEVKVFSLTGDLKETILLSSKIYKQPNYEKARGLTQSHKAWTKYLKSYSLVNGLYKVGGNYVTVLNNTRLGHDLGVLEFWDSDFLGFGRFPVNEKEKLVGAYQDMLVFYDADSRTLLFREIVQNKSRLKTETI